MPRPWRGLREGENRAEIFFGNLERAPKDGHFGAHEGGGKRGLTGESGSGEWGATVLLVKRFQESFSTAFGF